ncbi:phage protein [Bordetella pertussis]|uniref:transcriptional regulator n=2 Tax=Alcaligenaceae TaxID=506 RepID=UPI0003D1B39F|nr:MULTISPECIES: YdaS family helix-turn-helix protein [Bordetella]ETH45344.1 DNA-binding helix-turn-helix protein [Bordetella pertussis H939]ETH70628.1 DNA-binding helix-turn-helix protein [Bordetella pertussis STO1-CHLA-0011]ETH81864.1 DNA-binding helix-turn-helix protein [Bordetella pertussis STO1-CHOC-0017]ETH86231.1 DNA-binding helix-turn-helix protein [Bordetella pertussis STO1-CHOC-0018]ETI00689.1 DNA-binding helix-turn-helix protein [Bordetella pertussis STO1-CHOM-0012]SHT50794.1 Uncha
MDLNSYLNREDATSAAALAREVGVSPALVYQWRTGRRPVPVEHCAAIERATGGEVSRRDLRPGDWPRVWPELAAQAQQEVTHA